VSNQLKAITFRTSACDEHLDQVLTFCMDTDEDQVGDTCPVCEVERLSGLLEQAGQQTAIALAIAEENERIIDDLRGKLRKVGTMWVRYKEAFDLRGPGDINALQSRSWLDNFFRPKTGAPGRIKVPA